MTDPLAVFWASCRIRTNDPEITNHVLWPTELKRQTGKRSTSRRYNQVPLLRSSPGGFRGSMPCRTYPGAKVAIFPYAPNVFRWQNVILWLSNCFSWIFLRVKNCSSRKLFRQGRTEFGFLGILTDKTYDFSYFFFFFAQNFVQAI